MKYLPFAARFILIILCGFFGCQPDVQEQQNKPSAQPSIPQSPQLPDIPDTTPEIIVTGRWKVVDMQDGGMIDQVSAQLPAAQAQIFRARMTEMVSNVKKAGYRLFLPNGQYLNLVGTDTVMQGMWMVINNGKALLTKPLMGDDLPNQFTLRSLAHDAMVIEEPLNFPGKDTVQTYITTFIMQKEKVEFPLEQLDLEGLTGPPDGKRRLAYEFCIPADSALIPHLQHIAPNIQLMQGRIGCGEGWWLCLGETNPSAKQMLGKLAAQPYIHRIVETNFE